MRVYIKALKPIEKVSTLLCAQRYVTSSLILPMTYILDPHSSFYGGEDLVLTESTNIQWEQEVLPLVRVLMMGRTEEAYLEVLEYLKTLVPNFAPDRIHCDFERAQMNAFRTVLPSSRIVGCLWHYGVASSIHASKLGLSPIANENQEVKTFIRCIAGVPLLPAQKIWTGVLEIWNEVMQAGWEDELRPFFEYFEKEPRVAELSVFSVPERTNNVSESDNRTLASVIPQNRPNVWHLIGGFVQLDQLAFSDKLAIEKGNAPTSGKRWKAKLNDKRVKRLSDLISNEQISCARFPHEAAFAILAAVNHGLKLNNHDEEDSSDSD
ncbi:Pentatricopeptide repeat-containing protein [Frankliniella fusca]|uniref:Pentatricopeptide repeat-containing protein n=1 Tax=Frankliniella fusca TaxID=407009 RepID=A0AAE1LB19_9NEOP|nr:Pentatricopeptide repeat-containing protein [Frankliniella fusca]